MASDLDLGKMVGPLPMGAWVAVAGGGLLLAWYSKRHAAPAPATDTSATGGGGTPTLIVPPYGSPPANGGGLVAPTLSTNQDWYRQASSILEAHGFDATLVDRAVRDYLLGNQLSTQENGVIQQALQLVGPPPEMPPGSPLPPTPPPSSSSGGNLNVGGTPYLKGVAQNAKIVDVVTNPAGPGGWELDSWGGIQPFGGAPAPLKVPAPPYWPGGLGMPDGVAVALQVNPDGKSGNVFDLWGAPHPVRFP